MCVKSDGKMHLMFVAEPLAGLDWIGRAIDNKEWCARRKCVVVSLLGR